MLELWRMAYPPQGMFGGGAGHLPDRGGVLDQPVVMMAAFALMNRAAAMLDKEDRDRRGSE